MNATETAITEKPAPRAESGWLTKREVAQRYHLSQRQIDYLRKKKLLPYFVVPSRCIRFDPHACDRAMEKFRRNEGDQGPGRNGQTTRD